MGAEHLAGAAVDDLAGPGAELLAEPASGVAVADEADVVAVGRLGHREAAALRLFAHLALAGAAEREQTAHGLGDPFHVFSWSATQQGEVMAVGPVDVYIIGFPGNKFSGRIAPAIIENMIHAFEELKRFLETYHMVPQTAQEQKAPGIAKTRG